MAETNDSNMHSILRRAPEAVDGNRQVNADLWMNHQLWMKLRKCQWRMLFGAGRPATELRGEHARADHQASRPLGDLGVGE